MRIYFRNLLFLLAYSLAGMGFANPPEERYIFEPIAPFQAATETPAPGSLETFWQGLKIAQEFTRGLIHRFVMGPAPYSAALPTGTIAFHSYSAYDSLPGTTIRPLDGKIWLHDLKSQRKYPLDSVNRLVRHALNPRFSGNGRYLAFMGLPRGQVVGDDWPKFLHVYVFDFQGQVLIDVSTRTRTHSTIDEDPDFSPVENSLIFKRDRKDLWRYNLDTGAFSKIPIALDGEKSMPSHSLDGKWVAFALNAGYKSEIYQARVSDGYLEKVVSEHGNQHYYPVFLNLSELLYVRWKTPRQPIDQIWIKNLSENSIEALGCNDHYGAADKSDPFRIDQQWIGLSITNDQRNYKVFMCHKRSGHLYSIGSAVDQHELGGSYTTQEFARTLLEDQLTITYIRHGKVEHNEFFDQGKTREGRALRDPALTALGIEQAKFLKAKLAGESYDLIISSPLTRAIQTALIAFDKTDTPIYISALVSERGGSAPCDSGRPPLALKQSFPAEHFPLLDFKDLAENWLDSLDIENETAFQERVSKFQI